MQEVITEKDIETIFYKCFNSDDFQFDDTVKRWTVRYITAKMQSKSNVASISKDIVLAWFIKNRKNDLDIEFFKTNYREFFRLIDNKL